MRLYTVMLLCFDDFDFCLCYGPRFTVIGTRATRQCLRAHSETKTISQVFNCDFCIVMIFVLFICLLRDAYHNDFGYVVKVFRHLFISATAAL